MTFDLADITWCVPWYLKIPASLGLIALIMLSYSLLRVIAAFVINRIKGRSIIHTHFMILRRVSACLLVASTLSTIYALMRGDEEMLTYIEIIKKNQSIDPVTIGYFMHRSYIDYIYPVALGLIAPSLLYFAVAEWTILMRKKNQG